MPINGITLHLCLEDSMSIVPSICREKEILFLRKFSVKALTNAFLRDSYNLAYIDFTYNTISLTFCSFNIFLLPVKSKGSSLRKSLKLKSRLTFAVGIIIEQIPI